jgi:hypothetical protein
MGATAGRCWRMGFGLDATGGLAFDQADYVVAADPEPP